MIRAALLFAASMLWCGIGVTQDGRAGLQKNIEQALVEEGLTGIAWTLVEPDAEIRVGSAGLRDNQSKTAFSAETRFHVGSLTKTVLATGVLRLVTEGRIDLDAAAMDYLPAALRAELPPGFSTVTVRHLLDHTSGLDDARLWQMFSERAQPDAPLLAAFPDPAALLSPRSPPGTRFSYSNMGYGLLGIIIETVVGERYEAYLDRELLGPLGMHNSTFAFTAQAEDPSLAWGHVDDGSRYPASPIFLRPAGQFTSTAADLGRFTSFLLGDGELEGRIFIRPALMRSRATPRDTEAAKAGLDAGYSLGLGRTDRHGVVGHCHGGNIVGFVAKLCVFPEQGKAYAFSVNTDSESANYARIDGLLIEALGIPAAPIPASVDMVADIGDWQGRYVLSPNRFQSFAYLDTVFGAIRVADLGDELELSGLQQSPRRLRPIGDYRFVASDRSTASHVLIRHGTDELLVSDGFRTYQKVPSLFLFGHWTSLLLGIAGLLWLLGAGASSSFRYRTVMFSRPEAPAFLAIALLLIPLPLYAMQSFMALGDLTPASAALALVTLLLPLGLVWTLLRVWRASARSATAVVHGLAAAAVLQWCAVLTGAELLPLRMWQ